MKIGLVQGQSPGAHHTSVFWHWIKTEPVLMPYLCLDQTHDVLCPFSLV